MSSQVPEAAGHGPGRMLVVVSLLVAAVVGVGTGAVIGQRGPGDATAATEATTEPPTTQIEAASVESFDPVGGSGFRNEGDGTWSTQTYATAEFGALKEGVGLLVDLGEARDVSTVTLENATAGLSIELLAGDEPPAGGVEGLTAADSATTGEGETVLSGAEGGSHRYWMVWVTELAPSGDGFAAEVSTPVVEGPEG